MELGEWLLKGRLSAAWNVHGWFLKSFIISMEIGTDQSERTLTVNNLSSHTLYIG